jgi:hypothetical protein
VYIAARAWIRDVQGRTSAAGAGMRRSGRRAGCTSVPHRDVPMPQAVPRGVLPSGTLARPCASQDAVQGGTNVARDRMSKAPAQERPAKAKRPPGMAEGTTPWTEEVEPRREQRPRAMQAATGSLPFRGICTSVYVRAIAEMTESGYVPVHHPRAKRAPARPWIRTSLYISRFAHPVMHRDVRMPREIKEDRSGCSRGIHSIHGDTRGPNALPRGPGFATCRMHKCRKGQGWPRAATSLYIIRGPNALPRGPGFVRPCTSKKRRREAPLQLR